MIFLRFGDKLPTVAVIQRMINECRSKQPRLGAIRELVEDGIFGKNTRAAVAETQAALSIRPGNGEFGPATWSALAGIGVYKVLDVTDLALETLMQEKGRATIRAELRQRTQQKHPKKAQSEVERIVASTLKKYDTEIEENRHQHQRFKANGGDPVAMTSVRNNFDTIRRAIDAASRDGSRVVLLRFQAHGSPGRQGVGGSLFRGTPAVIDDNLLTFDDSDTTEQLVESIVACGMTMPMASFGCVELHGCNVAARRAVGRGRDRAMINGPAFIQNFANSIGRPVSATTVSDKFGTLKLDTRYEGPVVSCVPGGGTVRSWFSQN